MSGKFCIAVILLAFLVACKVDALEELESVSLVITNGVVFDGTGDEPIQNGLVAIRENLIVAIGQATDFKIPDGAIIIDAEGGTILPGIFNAHSHKDMGAGTRRIMFLLEGVTSVCDMMIPIKSMHFLDEQEIQSGPAARGFKAGPIITAPGGYPGVIFGIANSYEIQGSNEAEMAVRDLNTQGADYIKVALEPGIFGEPWPVLNLEELSAVVETAHSYGLRVRVHLNNAAFDLALDGGVDVIEHVPMPSFSYDDLKLMFDDAGIFRMSSELEAQMLRAIEQGIVLVPTLDVMINDSGHDEEIEIVNKAILGVVRFFHEAGGIIAVGNDYGNAGVKPGMPLREMELLQSAGLSPHEVLEAATNHAAYVCGKSEMLGTIEIGKLADIIVVDGNPLDDLSAMDSLLYIMKNGELVFSSTDDGK